MSRAKSESPETSALMMNDSAPLLVATPLYGTEGLGVEPETVTFDECTLPAAHATGDMLALRATASADFSGTAQSDDKVEKPVFRDVPYAILFWIQFIAVVILAFTVAPKGYSMIDFDKIKDAIRNDPTTSDTDFEHFEQFVAFAGKYIQIYPQRILTYLLIPAGWMAFFIAVIVTTTIIRPCPKFMVTACLLGAFIDMAILMIFMCISNKNIFSVMMACLVLSIIAYYIRVAWRLIPYSAVNLGVSLEGIQSNCGTYIVAFFLAKIGFFWAFFWFYVLVGVMVYVGETCCPGMTNDSDCAPQGWTFLSLLISFFWTIQVITNVRISIAVANQPALKLAWLIWTDVFSSHVHCG
jgi:hypothetical protein